MKMLRILYICLLLILLSCSKDDENNKKIPACLQAFIENILNKPVRSPKGYIKKYIYMGREVYVISHNIRPDGGASVIGLDCEPICVLGGFDGDQNDCPNFEDAEYIETVWIDPR